MLSKSDLSSYVYLAFSDSHIVIDLSVKTSAAWFRLAHGMSHLCATVGKLPIIFIILLTPTRRRCRVTTATRLRHGSGCIDIPCKQQHFSKSTYKMTALLTASVLKAA